MSQKSKPKTIVGITWYRPDQYDAVRTYCEDRDSKDATYQHCKAGVEKAMLELRSKGNEVVPVDFDLDEFKMWCSANGKRPIAKSRSAYTVQKLRDSHRS
jgi:hypothetical protein